MLTLFFVTLPVEVIFLAVLRALNWLRLPFPFVAASVFFFCLAVRARPYPAPSLFPLSK